MKAGRKALRQAESRVPPDLRKQLERTIKDGQKTLRTAIDQLETQVRRNAKQADIDRVFKRLDGLSKQVQKMARNATSGTPARASSTTRRVATPKRRATSTAKRRTPPRKPSARKAVAPEASTEAAAPARRRSSPRRSSPRRATSAESTTSQATPEPSWMPTSTDSEETPI
jgi:hypothetical protein